MPEIQPVPLPPLGAEEISTACDYCVVGCSYRVWRWKVGAGGTANTAVPWANPSQHNIVQWQGEPHHVLVLPDPQARAVNPMGNHSMRGGTLAQKCYNPENKTRERLTTPLLRVKGELQPVSWDTALNIMAAVSKHVLKNHGEHAWGVKAYSYQYFENTYAITRLALDAIGTPAFAPHDKCANGNDAAGLDDAGLEAFAPAYEDWGACDVLFMSGTDPFETKSTLFTSWIMRGGAPNKTLIFATPHRSMGVAWAEQRGGLWLPVIPGTDTSPAQRHRPGDCRTRLAGSGLHRTLGGKTLGGGSGLWPRYPQHALAMAHHLGHLAERLGGFPPVPHVARRAPVGACGTHHRRVGRADRTGRRTAGQTLCRRHATQGVLHAGEGQLLVQQLHEQRVLRRAGAGLRRRQSQGADDRPRRRPPARHDFRSRESRLALTRKYPGRRKKPLNLDRWLMDGQLRFAWVFGTTWIGAMAASDELERHIGSA
jgi:hypothetical protein